MAALITKYYAPTNTKSARIMVKGFGRKKVYTWDYALDTEDNYTNAMTDFINELNTRILTNYKITDIAYIGKAGSVLSVSSNKLFFRWSW